MNSYGLLNLWTQGDIVTRIVAVMLLVMSLLSWYVIVLKAWRLRQLMTMSSASKEFWHAQTFEDGLATLAPKEDNPYVSLAQEGAEAAAHHRQFRGDLHGALNISDWITSCLRRSIDDATVKLQAGLSVLASIGSTAPFVGLFGTVWGIYHALIGIASAGQASIDKVAGPVGEALIMTALGLVVAIPATLAYNALTRGNKAVLSKLNGFAHDVHAYFVTGGVVGRRDPQLKVAGEQ
ncbi:MAG TPA: MotA/TolQ/ExbB proton channel family protein [Rhodocyclaceae bacterium]|nr:MotA/TolQ/ExbB proton channel family protein [Rhodocyclaceae bacterium]